MEDDIIMYDFLKYYNIPVTIVATKLDKLAQKDLAKQEKLFQETFKLQDTDSIIPFSSMTKKGREEIYSTIETSLE